MLLGAQLEARFEKEEPGKGLGLRDVWMDLVMPNVVTREYEATMEQLKLLLSRNIREMEMVIERSFGCPLD